MPTMTPMVALVDSTTASGRWTAALAQPELQQWALLALAALAASAVLITILGRCRPVVTAPSLLQRCRNLLDDCQATAMVEFALVLPILLFLSLILAQTTLAMSGNLFVNSAAYAATRRAIVTLPLDYSAQSVTEPANVANIQNGLKMKQIKRAAVISLLPVAGRLEGAATPLTNALEQGLYELYGTATDGSAGPRWVAAFAADRFRYADAMTEVRLVRTRADQNDQMQFTELREGVAEFGPREPITVRVIHNLAMTVPYVRRLPVPTTSGFKPLFTDSFDVNYRVIEAQATLVNEGVSPELPPRPRQQPDFTQVLDRVDPP